jgi:hypothetical protein
LTLLEAPASVSAEAAPAWHAFVDEIEVLWGQEIRTRSGSSAS